MLTVLQLLLLLLVQSVTAQARVVATAVAVNGVGTVRKDTACVQGALLKTREAKKSCSKMQNELEPEPKSRFVK